MTRNLDKYISNRYIFYRENNLVNDDLKMQKTDDYKIDKKDDNRHE